jgi:hypothetical protein
LRRGHRCASRPTSTAPRGEHFTATPGAWVGATLGLFATAPPGSTHAAGVAGFDPVEVHAVRPDAHGEPPFSILP